MSAIVSPAASETVSESRTRPGRRVGQTIRNWVVPVFTALALLYLLLPIIVMIAFSFNDPPGRFNFVWGRFSLAAWGNPFGRPGLEDALVTSLVVAVISTLIATILGTLIALALSRYTLPRADGHEPVHLHPDGHAGDRAWREPADAVRRHGHRAVADADRRNPLPAGAADHPHRPHHVQHRFRRGDGPGADAGLPASSRRSGDGPRGTPWTTFWRVTFPLIFPGILAGALLAFSLSIDDFIITNFTSGTSSTFPIWVWASIRNNLPPQVHVIGTMVFAGAVALVVFSTLLERRSARRDRRIAAQEAAREVARVDAARLVPAD